MNNRGKYENQDYYHNMMIAKVMNQGREGGWALIQSRPHVQDTIRYQREAKLERNRRKAETSYLTEVEPLLKMHR